MGPKYKVGDLVLCKIPSYPKWPAVILPLRYVERAIWKERKPDRYCVKFFNDATYYWSSEKALEPLRNPGDIDLDEFSEYEGLADAYRDASQYRGLEDFLRSFKELLKEDEEFEDDGVCFYTKGMIIDGHTAKRAASKTKVKVQKKKAKTESTAPQEEVEGIEENDNKEDSSELKKRKGFKFRSVIQKGLIQRKTDPTEEELDHVNNTFKELEEYSPNIDIDFLRHSKLHKVLKAITKLDEEPSEKYNFQYRSGQLLLNWEQPILELKKEKDAQRDTPISSILDSHHDVKSESSNDQLKVNGNGNGNDTGNGEHNEANTIKNE